MCGGSKGVVMDVDVKTGEFAVRLVIDPRARSEVVAYVAKQMTERFGHAPPPTEGSIFAAYKDGCVGGVIVFNTTTTHEPFELERHFLFDPSKSPLVFARERMVTATRWTATMKRASFEVLYGAAHAALAFGKDLMLIEAKQYSVDRLRQLGIECHIIPDTRLNMSYLQERLSGEGLLYYQGSEEPQMVIMSLRQLIAIKSG